MPASYLPPLTAGRMESKVAMVKCGFTPSFALTAVASSIPQPIGLPIASLNSFGRYVASTPKVMKPAFLMLAGNLAIAALSVAANAPVWEPRIVAAASITTADFRANERDSDSG